MRMWAQSHLCQKPQRINSVLSAAFALIFLILGASQSASALPAFARKYGLRCSACHESWPMLNYFGQKFKDNGYQLMNERDSPIWQNPGYWPVTFRILPIWHRVSKGKQQVDTVPGNGDGLGRAADHLVGFRSQRPRLSHRWHSGEEHFLLCPPFLRRHRFLPL